MRDLFSPTETSASGERLLVSVSGGQTSHFMSWLIESRFSHLWQRRVYVFANTGQEHERTLEFVRDFEQHFGIPIVWVEAVVNPEHGQGTTHRVVNFETAHRGDELFEAVVKKYGIPNASHPHCNRELKLNPIHSYVRNALGWATGSYSTAVGIRPDEARRVSAGAAKTWRIVYPLMDWFYADKIDVNTFWEDQPFRLGLREHEGNCRWCWKKSFAKHHRLLQESPEIYAVPARLEAQYGRTGPEFEGPNAPRAPRVFFRRNTSTLNLPAVCAAEVAAPRRTVVNEDEDSVCAASCEVFPMEGARTTDLFDLAAA